MGFPRAVRSAGAADGGWKDGRSRSPGQFREESPVGVSGEVTVAGRSSARAPPAWRERVRELRRTGKKNDRNAEVMLRPAARWHPERWSP